MRKLTVNLKNARREDQRSVMEKIKKDGVCPFCWNYFLKYHTEPIVYKNNSWLLTNNAYPYEGTKYHLLLISKRHILSIEKLNEKEWQDLHKVITWAVKKYKIKGGTLLFRFGATTKNGSSVAHLHNHIVVGKGSESSQNPIRAKIGYGK